MSVNERADDKQRSASHLFFWDSTNLPQNERLDAYLRAIPWTPQNSVEAQMAGAQVDTGFVIRARTGADLAVHRNAQNIAASTHDCYIGAFCISGDFTVEQGGTLTHAVPGDTVVYDSALPTRVRGGGSTKQDWLGFYIPKDVLASKPLRSGSLKNILIPRDSMLNPLSQCLVSMARNLLTYSEAELWGLWDACTSLVPVAAGSYRNGATESSLDTSNPVFRRILGFVDANLSNPGLSAMEVAATLGLSDRYIHKLFASRGMTFSAHVRAKRLDHVFAELSGNQYGSQQISEIAFKWGFNDISTFNRAFKTRFGWSPRRCRT